VFDEERPMVQDLPDEERRLLARAVFQKVERYPASPVVSAERNAKSDRFGAAVCAPVHVSLRAEDPEERFVSADQTGLVVAIDPIGNNHPEAPAKEFGMENQQIIERINELAREEHELWEREGRAEASEPERQRLKSLGVTLDQCWDLLHQRRARQRAGQDPDNARVRDPETVEGYLG
jgi:hypothetical protein